MNFELTENQKMIAEMVRAFAKEHIAPYVMEWDEKQIFPVDTFKKNGRVGITWCFSSTRIWW